MPMVADKLARTAVLVVMAAISQERQARLVRLCRLLLCDARHLAAEVQEGLAVVPTAVYRKLAARED